MSDNLKFGSFIAPYHSLNEDAGQAIERDLELVVYLEKLGFDEAWIGEHHSGGMELVGSPELFIAIAAERTKSITLATGVISLPYHNPLMTAERINFLDHVTKGRVVLGMGPGSLPTDAQMLSIPVTESRKRMDEAVEVVAALLRGEWVTKKTDWFELNNAHLQLRPYSRPSIEMVVSSVASPGGSVAAGKIGGSILSVAATQVGGFNTLASNWAIAEQSAAEHGHTMDRSKWRLAGPMHIAETREQARKDVEFGIQEWARYFSDVAALSLIPPGADPVEALIESGFAVIGTPDDAIAQIERLENQSGGFGTFLNFDTNWADWEQKKRSYELIARHVRPHFKKSQTNRSASWNWAADRREELVQQVQASVGVRIAQHVAEKGTNNINPEYLAAMGVKTDS
ncbi:LLM class flavin-dependent oxidoreductase [Sphingomonas sp. TX0543]|uniref:LLM class flavin-dependent oxidoreductase n=1 Tax=unclassified Sphingomonas TaxID=196159 RepID=UPI0010F76D26|nr:LLM class flavin-dependent oxidoreductase [Sphingomonas sp. 3P27F8]